MDLRALAKVTMLTLAFLLVLTMGAFMGALVVKPSHAAGTVQYRVVPTHTGAATEAQLKTILDEEGKQGWELVMKYGTEGGDVLIFKK